MVWFAGTPRATAVSQSFPAAYTNELACVVVNDTVDSPVAALFDADAPTPDDPANATTVSAWRNPPTSGVDVTVTFVNAVGAKAAHTSAVPNRAFVRFTNDHVNPAPDTVTDCDATEAGPSDRTNATNHRPAPVVENAAVDPVPVTDAFTVTSTASAGAVTV
jgi:hexokinase